MRFSGRFPHEILRRLLPRAWGEDAVGDLVEEWREWRRRDGAVPAAARYAWRAGGLLLWGAADGLRRPPPLVAQLWPDVRRLARRPLIPLTAALALGPALAGAGAFGALSFGAFLEPLPYPDAERLVVVGHDAPGLPETRQSSGLHLHYRPRACSAEAMGLFRLDGANAILPRGARRVPVTRVTAETLRLLGARALHGRLLEDHEDLATAAPAALLSHAGWRRHFGSDPDVVGRSVEVDGVVRTVVGVLAPEPALPGPAPDLVLPAGLVPGEAPLTAFTWTGSLARLAPGASPEGLEAELGDLMRTAPLESPDGYVTVEGLARDGIVPSVMPLAAWRARDVRPLLATGTAASFLLLGLTVAAVLGLVLGRPGRAGELRVRRAMGASSARLSLLAGLEAASALAGACVAGAAGAAVLASLLERTLGTSGAGESVAAARAAAAAAVLGLLLVPGLAAARGGGGRGRAPRARSTRRIGARPALLAAQVAVATVLVASAVAVGRSAWTLVATDLGFDPTRLVTFGVVLPEAPYGERPEVALELQRALSRRLGALEGVQAAAFGVGIPGTHAGWIQPWEVEGHAAPPGSEPAHRFRDVSATYLDVLGIPLVAGRGFTEEDADGPPAAALVNEAFARLYWGAPEAAVGRRVRWVGEGAWRTVVGVVGNTADAGPAEPPGPMLYRPLAATATAAPGTLRFMQHALRGPRSVEAVERSVREALAELDPSVPAFSFDTGTRAVLRTAAPEGLALVLVTAATAAGVLAAALGLGGLVLLGVLDGSRAVGIRKAVGAADRRLRLEALRPVLLPSLTGLAAGLALVTAGLRVPPALLHGAGPWTSHLAAAATLVVPVLLAAAYLGSRHVTRIAPATALRAD